MILSFRSNLHQTNVIVIRKFPFGSCVLSLVIYIEENLASARGHLALKMEVGYGAEIFLVDKTHFDGTLG